LDVQAMESRVGELEAKATEHAHAVARLESAVAAGKQRGEQLQGQLDTSRVQCAELEGKLEQGDDQLRAAQAAREAAEAAAEARAADVLRAAVEASDCSAKAVAQTEAALITAHAATAAAEAAAAAAVAAQSRQQSSAAEAERRLQMLLVEATASHAALLHRVAEEAAAAEAAVRSEMDVAVGGAREQLDDLTAQLAEAAEAAAEAAQRATDAERQLGQATRALEALRSSQVAEGGALSVEVAALQVRTLEGALNRDGKKGYRFPAAPVESSSRASPPPQAARW
jgi:uncharacterized coiled-coil protein SlyX